MLQQSMRCHLVDKNVWIKRKEHIWDLSKFTHSPSWNPNVYCVYEGRCCSNQCDVIRLTRVCGSRGKNTSGIYQSLHTHHPGTLMCIVYVREDVATLNARRQYHSVDKSVWIKRKERIWVSPNPVTLAAPEP